MSSVNSSPSKKNVFRNQYFQAGMLALIFPVPGAWRNRFQWIIHHKVY
jgi:hypothetical protein